MFDYWCVQMVYTEILVFQNRVISKDVYEIVHVCPPHTAQVGPLSSSFPDPSLSNPSTLLSDKFGSLAMLMAFQGSEA